MSERKELATVERCDCCKFWKRLDPMTDMHGDEWGWYTDCGGVDWQEPPESYYGWCRRFPPQLVNLGCPELPPGVSVVLRPIEHATRFPCTENENWCGEYQPTPPAVPPFDFSGWLMDRSVRVRKSINRRGVKSLPDLFAIAPSDYKHLGMTGYLEAVNSLRSLGVVIPETWTW